MKNSKKIIIAIAIFFSLPQSAFLQSFSFSTPSFNDTDNHHYIKSINFIGRQGIVNGYEDGSFRPNNKINRAELLKIIIEAKVAEDELKAYDEENCFSDVKPGKWYTKYVCYAKSKGIIKGYSNNTFRPKRYIKFDEALKITMATFGYPFNESESPWYKDLVNEASHRNLIPLDIIGFKEEVTRAQIADLIARTLKKESGELDEFLGEKKDYIQSYQNLAKGENLLLKAEKEIQEKKDSEVSIDPAIKKEIIEAIKGFYGSYKAKPDAEEIKKYSAETLPEKLFANPFISPIMHGISKKADEFKIKQYEENLAYLEINLEENGSKLEDSNLLVRLAGNQWKVSSKIQAIEESKNGTVDDFNKMNTIEEIRALKKGEDGIDIEEYNNWQKEAWTKILEENTKDISEENPFDSMIRDSKNLREDINQLLSAFSKYLEENTEPLQCLFGQSKEEAKLSEIPECDPDNSGKGNKDGAFEGAVPIGKISAEYWGKAYDCSSKLTPKYINKMPINQKNENFSEYSDKHTGYWVCQEKKDNKIYVLFDQPDYNVETFELEGDCETPGGGATPPSPVFCLSKTIK